MNTEQTLSIIKPDIIKQNKIGKVISRFETHGLKIKNMKMLILSKDDARKFYKEHKDKVFFNELVNFISSGPLIVQVLEGDNAIMKNREIMGHTNPKLANKGTIRHDFASSIDENAVHGSDSAQSAKKEIEFFFNK
jgi:nucleoside-diphosphate kinase